tara:strand:- start:26 stop:658 length:633 start_codon:yes stop_codon:yes gene_type:complete
MLKLEPKLFPNIGWLETKLPPNVLTFLNKCIKNKTSQGFNNHLAGNIYNSVLLEDKNEWFFKNVLTPSILKYIDVFSNRCVPKLLTKDCTYSMSKFWVNFQKKYEFNPMHDHAGVFSFVVWMKIPSSYKKEKNLPFVKGSNLPSASTFHFQYTNALGQGASHYYKLDPSYEGTMLFFPSQLQHQVYPFYTSDKNRVSISGNVCLDPDKPV